MTKEQKRELYAMMLVEEGLSGEIEYLANIAWMIRHTPLEKRPKTLDRIHREMLEE